MQKNRPPAEWEPHRACWSAWPSHKEIWQENLESAQLEFTQLCKAIALSEKLEILIPFPEQLMIAAHALRGLKVRFHAVPFGDIRLRDIVPIFTRNLETSQLQTVRFGFNGWGGKYQPIHEDQVSKKVTDLMGVPFREFPWILEGSAIEMDGRGTALTTRQCLLNSNRNNDRVPSENEVEERLKEALNIEKVLWIEEGLLNDYADGHIDNLVRFVAPGHVVCLKTSGKSDPNEKVFKNIYEQLLNFTDVNGQKLKITQVNSPGNFENNEGHVVPASPLSFYISNKIVIVPVFETEYDDLAVSQIAQCFPSRKTIGVKASSLLFGGGAFHSITQQEPT